jgi:phosphoribosylglycinamide formyltransferase-1
MLRLTVLASGGGTNLQALIDAQESGELDATIVRVVADRPAFALERARRHNIPEVLLDRKILQRALSSVIHEEIKKDTDLIVLAGYLSIFSPEFIAAWKGKIINIHPSLLPEFGGKGMYGIHVHEAVLAAGRKESGCSVHYVEEGIDTGEVILQKKVPVMPGDTPETLQQRVLEQEHDALVEAVNRLADRKKN